MKTPEHLQFEVDSELADKIDTLLANHKVPVSTAVGTLLWLVSVTTAENPCPDVPLEMDRDVRKRIMVTLLEGMIDREYEELREAANAPKN